VPIDEIERRYSPNPFSRMAHGDIVGYVDQTRFLLQSGLQIAAIVHGGQTPPEQEISRFFRRLEIGLPDDALQLLDLPIVLTRGEYLALFQSGARSVEAVCALTRDQLAAALGRARAVELAARLEH
jgi:helicase